MSRPGVEDQRVVRAGVALVLEGLEGGDGREEDHRVLGVDAGDPQLELALRRLLQGVGVADREVLVLGPALVDEHRAVGEVGERPAHQLDAQERRVARVDTGDAEEVAVALGLAPALPDDAVDPVDLGHLAGDAR